nr:hypothetical protein [uncultured Flavonifractor sp.]
MRLLVWEWRKLFRLPALWVFLGLCLVLNGVLLSAPSALDRAFFNHTSADAAALGQRVDEDFQAGLTTLPYTEDRDLLRQSTEGMENIFAGYDTGRELTGFYRQVMKEDPVAQEWMAWKYRLLQGRVDHLARTGAAMDLYVGPITHASHQYLWDTLFRAVVTEGLLLGLLCALYLVGHEELAGTAALTCASRTGRKLWRSKVLAALLAALGLYALLALCTLGPYLVLWDYGGIWSASVSSQFNYLVDMLYARPFLTWADFTVGGYFAAMVAAGGGLVAVFALIGAAAGLTTGHTYGAAIAAAALCALMLGLSSLLANLGLWSVYLFTTFAPVNLWMSIGGWFTELGQAGAVPWQETVGLTLNLLAWGGLTLLALRRFARKDVA